ncbi:MAG: hypothetical protein Kow0099_07340 [Candidatus Abyssubacteria bacterium]
MTTTPTGVPQVKISEWLRQGWDVFVSDVGMFLLASLLYTILNGICLAGIVLFGPLTCGMYLMIFQRMRGGAAEVRLLFKGFDYFGNAFLAGLAFFVLWLLSLIITYAGMSCIIGAFLGVALLVLIHTAFLFTFQLIGERGFGAGEAISTSWNKVRENLREFLLFGLVLALINLAGYAVMLGWLITVPLTLCASAAAYQDVFGLEDVQAIEPVQS